MMYYAPVTYASPLTAAGACAPVHLCNGLRHMFVACVPAAEVAACISIVEGDLLQVPLRDATVVYAYLLPQGGLSAILLP